MSPEKEKTETQPEEKVRKVHTTDSLYKDHVDALFSYALGFGLDKDSAMDAVHDVFCKVCLREEDLRKINYPRFYLLRMLRNQLIDGYKHRRDHAEVSVDDATDELPYKISISLEDEAIAAEERADILQRVDEILEGLTQRQREVIYLRFMQELSYTEIAGIMNMNVSACRKLLYRTMIKLKHQHTLVLFYLLLSIKVS